MNFFRIRGGAAVLAVGLTLTALFGSGPFCSTGHAQVIIGGAAGGPPSGVIYPSQQYYVALGLYREGRLPDAIDGFRGAIRSARTDAAGKWVDAIPSLAMLGECYYQNGDLGLALDQFDQALQITLRYDGWIGALQWPGTLAPVASEWRPSWMSRNRNLTAGQLPRNVLLATGVLDQTQVIQNGGVVNVPTLNRIDGVEVLRGLAIVLYRRAQILGPLAVGEQLNERLLVAFATGRSATEGWAKPLVGTLQGLTMLQDGQYDAAQVLLKDSMQLVGSLEHSLSPIARTALANILLRSGNAGNAANALPLYNDASVSAALWQQPEWIVEPLTRAVGPALASGQVDEIYNAASGANTTMNRDFRTFGAHCSLIAGEIAANGNKADEAFRRLTDTAPVLASGRKPAGSSRTQAYAQYVRAVTSAVQGNVADANQAIGLATTFAKGTPQAIASPRLFQLSRIGLAARTANLGDLTTENRLLELLNLEAPGPWINDPVEALAVQTSDLTNFSSLMVDIARRRNKNELVVQRLDDWQRQSFRQSLPWGGRLSDLRWLVASSEDWLPPDAATARQNLPAVFQPLQNQLRELSLVTGQLSVMPPADVKNQAARREMITRVERGGDLAEAMILRLGLMRASVPALFPPRLADPQWYNRIPSDGAILGFANISDRLVGVWATSKELRIWNVTSRNVGTLTMNLLQAIQTPRDATGRPVDQALLAANLAQVLLPDGWTLPANVRRLVIVPAGPLWQVPSSCYLRQGPTVDRLAKRRSVRMRQRMAWRSILYLYLTQHCSTGL